MEIYNSATSVNMDCEFYRKIKKAACFFDIPPASIFMDLMTLVIESSKIESPENTLVEYQSHKPDKWKKFYFSVNREEADLFAHVRCVLKLSVSKLAFMAFVLFWDVLIRKYKDRLKFKSNKKNPHSYDVHSKKYKNYTETFKIRLKTEQKE